MKVSKQVCAKILIFSFIFTSLFYQQKAFAASKYGEVTRYNGTWTAKVDGVTVYTGSDMFTAVQTALSNLTTGRTWKETVRIKNSGSSGSSGGSIKAINIPSYTILDFGGCTIECNSGDELIVPVQGERRDQIEIKNLKVTGNPRYGIWLKSCTNITISDITMDLTSGLGIRVDYSKGTWSTNVSIDNTNITGASDHAIETYGVDGLTVGTVTSSDTGGCGLLLNLTKNATIGTVNATRANNGGGYAAFRIANNAGPGITVDKVIARDCGRGFFSVSGSNGCTIAYVDISGSTSQGILIEDSQNIVVNGGIIKNCNGEGVRITSRSSTEFTASQYNTVQNLRVYDDRSSRAMPYGIRETLPRTNHNYILNNDVRNGGTVSNLVYEGSGTVATGNITQ